MNSTEKIFFPTDKGVAEKMIQKPKKTFFFSTVDQENIHFGDAIAQKAYFNALNFAIWIMSMSKQILK